MKLWDFSNWAHFVAAGGGQQESFDGDDLQFPALRKHFFCWHRLHWMSSLIDHHFLWKIVIGATATFSSLSTREWTPRRPPPWQPEYLSFDSSFHHRFVFLHSFRFLKFNLQTLSNPTALIARQTMALVRQITMNIWTAHSSSPLRDEKTAHP